MHVTYITSKSTSQSGHERNDISLFTSMICKLWIRKNLLGVFETIFVLLLFVASLFWSIKWRMSKLLHSTDYTDEQAHIQHVTGYRALTLNHPNTSYQYLLEKSVLFRWQGLWGGHSYLSPSATGLITKFSSPPPASCNAQDGYRSLTSRTLCEQWAGHRKPECFSIDVARTQ